MNVKVLRQFSHRVLAPMAANATFALNAGVWFRRARLLIVSPESAATACPLSGRNSTYRSVQISGTSSDLKKLRRSLVRLAWRSFAR